MIPKATDNPLSNSLGNKPPLDWDSFSLWHRAIEQQDRHRRLQRFAQTVTVVGSVFLTAVGLAGGYGASLWQVSVSASPPEAKAVFLVAAGFFLFGCISFLYARLILSGVDDEDRSLLASMRIRDTIAAMDVILPELEAKATGRNDAGGAAGAT